LQPRRQQRLPDLRQPKLAHKAGRRGAADGTESTRERALLHARDPAKLGDARRLSRIGARDRIETIDDPVIALPSRHDRLPRWNRCRLLRCDRAARYCP
jgi:hypothetical protein